MKNPLPACSKVAVVFLFWLALATTVLAQSSAIGPAQGGTAESPGGETFFHKWFERVTRIQAEQPVWITPLVTVTPRLEQEFRSDLSRQAGPDGGTTENYGGGKGLEIIPAEPMEVILGLPPYLAHNQPAVHDGFGDTSFLLKYRVLAADQEKGNYILSLFLGASVPTGSYSNGAEDAIITPTVAFGKGWGNFDVQSTLGVGLPTGDTDRLGRPIAYNTAFQYRVAKTFWPEMEVNATFWPDGLKAGKKQVFLTPGLVIGRLPIHNRLGLTLGGGVQIAATRFHTYDHNWILSVRLPF